MALSTAGKAAAKAPKKNPNANASLDRMEEAASILRRLPARAWAIWAIGTLPFPAALITFFVEMAHSPFAMHSLHIWAIALTILWAIRVAAYGSWSISVLSVKAGGVFTGPPRGKRLRSFGAQALLHALHFIFYPISACIGVTIGLSVGGIAGLYGVWATGGGTARHSLRKSWDGVAETLAVSLSALLITLIVFVNLIVLAFVGPTLIRALTGTSALNWSTTRELLSSGVLWLLMAATAHLMTEPLVRASALLSWFYASARTTGADLLAELDAQSPEPSRSKGITKVVAAAALLALLLTPQATFALPSGLPATEIVAEAAPVEDINDALDRTFQRREFLWKLPPPPEELAELNNDLSKPDEPTGFFRSIERMIKTMGEWAQSFEKFLERWFKKKPSPAAPIPTTPTSTSSGIDYLVFVRLLLGLLLIALVVAAGIAILRIVKERRKDDEIDYSAAPPLPDWTREEVAADQYPEEEWLRLASECEAKGDYRLAVRAVYLAVLARLGRMDLITVARSTSNSEYRRELRRRAYWCPKVMGGFDRTARHFERSWYGEHTAGPDELLAVRGVFDSLPDARPEAVAA